MKSYVLLSLFLFAQNLYSQNSPTFDTPVGHNEVGILPPEKDIYADSHIVIDGVLSDTKIKDRDIQSKQMSLKKKTFFDLGVDTSKHIWIFNTLNNQVENYVYSKVKKKIPLTYKIPIVVNGSFFASYRKRKELLKNLETTEILSCSYVDAKTARKKYGKQIFFGVVEIKAVKNGE